MQTKKIYGTPGQIDVLETGSDSLRVQLTSPGTAAGTFNQVTVDGFGRVIGGQNIPLPASAGQTGATGPKGNTGDPGPAGPSGGSTSVVATVNIPAFAAVISTGKPADSSNMGHFGKVIGMAPAAIANGFSGSIVESGDVTNPAWTWTTGDLIFLNGTSLSTTPPSVGFAQYIAIAKGPTVVVVELGTPMSL